MAKCDICQRNKYQAMGPTCLLQPLSIPHQVSEDINMDFIVKLLKSQGFDIVMVVVDRLMKYAHFIPLSYPYIVKTMSTVFVQEIVRLHGFPKSIVLNREWVFISQFWKEMFKAAGTSLKFSLWYHSKIDGQTEVINRTLETYFRCFVVDKPKQWCK